MVSGVVDGVVDGVVSGVVDGVVEGVVEGVVSAVVDGVVDGVVDWVVMERVYEESVTNYGTRNLQRYRARCCGWRCCTFGRYGHRGLSCSLDSN